MSIPNVSGRRRWLAVLAPVLPASASSLSDADPGTPSYTSGAIATVRDLNGDGRPEAVVTEGGTYCYGKPCKVNRAAPDGSADDCGDQKGSTRRGVSSSGSICLSM